MSKLSAAERKEVTDYLCDKVDEVPLATFEPAPKKPRTALDMFDDDDVDDVTTTCELDRYKGLTLATAYPCPLDFWKEHTTTFPALARVAKSVLVVMGSSAPSERVFSLAGHVISKRRTKLKPDIVDDILLLNSMK